MFEGLREEMDRAGQVKELLELKNALVQTVFNHEHSLQFHFIYIGELTDDQIDSLEAEKVKAQRADVDVEGCVYNFTF